jgi:hypothetical protein
MLQRIVHFGQNSGQLQSTQDPRRQSGRGGRGGCELKVKDDSQFPIN